MPGNEISDKYVRQYKEINYNVYPEFTINRSFEDLRRNFNEKPNVQLILAINSENTELVGFINIQPIKNTEHHHFNMLVHGDFHRIGIGSCLLSEAKKRYDVLQGVMVPTDDYKLRNGKVYGNPIKFYEKNGFKLTGKKFVEYGDVELVEMKWERNPISFTSDS